MSGIDVRISLGDDLSQALARARIAAVDMTEPMQEIALHLVSTTLDRFEQERNPEGVPWAPTARQRDNPGAKILQLSGMLRNAIEPDWGADYAAVGVEAAGGPAIYAAIHQFGGTIRPKNKQALSFAGRVVASVTIPARAYLGFDEINRGFSLDAIRDHLYRAFVGGGAAPAGAE